jgi:hypothetical protein
LSSDQSFDRFLAPIIAEATGPLQAEVARLEAERPQAVFAAVSPYFLKAETEPLRRLTYEIWGSLTRSAWFLDNVVEKRLRTLEARINFDETE